MHNGGRFHFGEKIMKKYPRPESAPSWAKYIAQDRNGLIHYFNHKHIYADLSCSGMNQEWVCVDNKTIQYKASNISEYCTDWKKSLRKLISRPSRKELHAEIAKLNRIINQMAPEEKLITRRKINQGEKA